MKYGVWILWGEFVEDGDKPVYYEFDSPEELSAFLRGVDEGHGWMDYTIREDGTPYTSQEDREPDDDED